MAMTYSFTQMRQYWACPRRYRHRYRDGWQEKGTRAGMLFGRCFEQALAAYFLRHDPGAALFKAWSAYQASPLEYSNGETWDKLLHQGIHLLEVFARDNRIRILQPRRNLQRKLICSLAGKNGFVAYIDAIGQLDGSPCLIEWKTTTSRYPEEPEGLLALDPQLVCYSWITGIEDVALVVFVRKHMAEIQYLRTRISQAQRDEFQQLVEQTVQQIETGQFPPHSGIRFPQNGCVSCPFLGLCLDQPQLVATHLVRQPGASDLDWIDHLDG